MKIINTKTGEILYEGKWQDYRMSTTSPSAKLEVTRTEAPSETVKHEFDLRTDACKFCGLPASGLKEYPQLADCAGRTEAPSAGGADVPADPETPASDEAAKV